MAEIKNKNKNQKIGGGSMESGNKNGGIKTKNIVELYKQYETKSTIKTSGSTHSDIIREIIDDLYKAFNTPIKMRTIVKMLKNEKEIILNNGSKKIDISEFNKYSYTNLRIKVENAIKTKKSKYTLETIKGVTYIKPK